MRLTKHHGLGNDFLVASDPDTPPDPDLARAACDRHRGVGADGLLHLSPASTDSGADVVMVLLNADGSRAEMSGNGIGCLAQAAVLGGLASGPTVRVDTDAGLRVVTLQAAPAARTHLATVAMGPVTTSGDDDPTWAVEGVGRTLRVDVGNPHLVLLLADAARLADREWLSDLGQKANAGIAGGINVEIVTAGAGGDVRMDVYERGVGLTDACGTGAVAAAVAARRWGLAGDDVTVAMVGGPVRVRLDGAEPLLTTTVAHVADIEFPWP